MKSFSQFINESPLRAMSVNKRLVKDDSLYVGMTHTDDEGKFFPVMKYKVMSPDETIIAKVREQGGMKVITYVGKWSNVKSSSVKEWTDVIPQIRKDLGKKI